MKIGKTLALSYNLSHCLFDILQTNCFLSNWQAASLRQKKIRYLPLEYRQGRPWGIRRILMASLNLYVSSDSRPNFSSSNDKHCTSSVQMWNFSQTLVLCPFVPLKAAKRWHLTWTWQTTSNSHQPIRQCVTFHISQTITFAFSLIRISHKFTMHHFTC